MKAIQYQVLRYLPDRVSGEFVNLGIVAYCPQEKNIQGSFYLKSTRLHSFFPTVNSRYIIRTLKSIDAFIKKMNTDFKKPLFTNAPSNLREITQNILPEDDSALFFTDVSKILDLDVDTVLKDLYLRLVLKYVHETDHDTLADKAVWKQHYKDYFDKYRLTEKLHPGKVKTKMDEWDFERTVQNGTLHCFESVTFDLSSDDYIRKKVYTWAGRVDELKSAKEPIHLYLLSVLPDKKELQKFIKEKLDNKELGNTIIEIVHPKEAEKIIKKVKTALENHQ